MWNDIQRILAENLKGHFVGTFVNINDSGAIAPGHVNKYFIIDGQQRITTLTLILIALRDYALENKNTGIDAAELEESYLKNKKAPGEEKYKLLLTGDDKKNLIELIDRTFNYDLLQNQQNTTVSDLCFDLHKKALYYTNIKFARSDDQNLKDIYSEIKELKMEVVFPFLLKLHADCFRRNPVLQKKRFNKNHEALYKLCRTTRNL